MVRGGSASSPGGSNKDISLVSFRAHTLLDLGQGRLYARAFAL